MAMCVIGVVDVAPCQCFSLGGHQTTSPGRISTFGPPSLCTQPTPDVTISICPSGCRCQADLAPGSNVTLAQRARAGSGASKSGSIRTCPVKYCSGPMAEGCVPFLLSSISDSLHHIRRLRGFRRHTKRLRAKAKKKAKEKKHCREIAASTQEATITLYSHPLALSALSV